MRYSVDGEEAVQVCDGIGYPLFFKTKGKAEEFANTHVWSNRCGYEILELKGKVNDQSKPTTA